MASQSQRRIRDRVEVPMQVSRARWILMVYFGLNGLFFISVMTRMPSIRDALQVDPAQLGSVLLAASLGSISIVAFGGVLIARFGGRLMLHVSTGIFVTAFLLIALSTVTGDLHWIALGMFLKGVSWVIGNVPLNVESAAVERAVGRTIMPQFHAMYSIGAVVGGRVGLCCRVPPGWWRVPPGRRGGPPCRRYGPAATGPPSPRSRRSAAAPWSTAG